MPEYPEALGYLYGWFRRLGNQRQVGMESNPLSFEGIGWFAKLNLIEMHVWEVMTLERLDIAVRKVWQTGKVAPPKPDRSGQPHDEDEQIPVTNAKGIRSLMQHLKAKNLDRERGIR